MLIGRGTECTRIEERLAAARERRSSALLLVGAPGIGKSALLRWARERSPDMTVLEAAGVESESELPYAGLSQLLAPVRDRQRTLIPRQREALELALGGEAGAGVDRYAVYNATLALLSEVAEDGPLLVLVDDTHWLDRGSAEALNFAARRLHREPILLLAAGRRRIDPPLPARHVEILRVGALGPAGAREVLARRPAPRSRPRSRSGCTGRPAACRSASWSSRTRSRPGSSPTATRCPTRSPPARTSSGPTAPASPRCPRPRSARC